MTDDTALKIAAQLVTLIRSAWEQTDIANRANADIMLDGALEVAVAVTGKPYAGISNELLEAAGAHASPADAAAQLAAYLVD